MTKAVFLVGGAGKRRKGKSISPAYCRYRHSSALFHLLNATDGLITGAKEENRHFVQGEERGGSFLYRLE
jgi:hypothetical protein